MASTSGSFAALPQKLHHRLEGIVRVVQQDVARRMTEKFLVLGNVLGKLLRHRGREWRVLQILAVMPAVSISRFIESGPARR